MSTGLTLYAIEATLAQLIATRDEMLECEEDTAAIDQQIAEYLRVEIRKVDGVRAYIRNCEATAEATAAEAKRLKNEATYWQRQADWMGGLVIRTMQELGLTELPGRVGRLWLKENPPHVEIQSAAIVPDTYKVHTLKVPPELWAILASGAVCAQFPPSLSGLWYEVLLAAKAEVRLSAIAEELKLPCEQCEGKGRVYRYDLAEYEQCPTCRGSKLRGVPGATLERRVKLEVT